MSYAKQVWGHFFSMDSNGDKFPDSTKMLEYLNENKTDGKHGKKNNQLMYLLHSINVCKHLLCISALFWCHSRGGIYKFWLAGKLPGIQSNTYRGAHPIMKTWVYTNSCKIWTWNRLKMLRKRFWFCVWLFGINIQPDWFFLKPFSVLSLN